MMRMCSWLVLQEEGKVSQVAQNSADQARLSLYAWMGIQIGCQQHDR